MERFWYEAFSNIVTVIGFIIIYTHQNTKIKSLSDIISNQKVGIDSQDTVLRSAMDYANLFDIKKVEETVKYQLDFENNSKMREIEEKFEQEKQEITKDTIDLVVSKILSDDGMDKMIDLIASKTFTTTYEIFQDPLMLYIGNILSMKEEERILFIDNIQNQRLKRIVLQTIDESHLISQK